MGHFVTTRDTKREIIHRALPYNLLEYSKILPPQSTLINYHRRLPLGVCLILARRTLEKELLSRALMYTLNSIFFSGV